MLVVCCILRIFVLQLVLFVPSSFVFFYASFRSAVIFVFSLFVGVVLWTYLSFLWVLFFVIISPFVAPGVAVIGSRLFLNSFRGMCIFYVSIVFAVGNGYPHLPFLVGAIYFF